jgi:putative transposase
MYVKLNGRMVCLWRAVDQEGEVLESYITTTRDKAAALMFMKKASKRHGSRDDHPHGLRSSNADERAWLRGEAGGWPLGLRSSTRSLAGEVEI